MGWVLAVLTVTIALLSFLPPIWIPTTVIAASCLLNLMLTCRPDLQYRAWYGLAVLATIAGLLQGYSDSDYLLLSPPWILGHLVIVLPCVAETISNSQFS